MTQYDALLLVSFGGPEGPDDVVPFLQNVTKGRNIPADRLREVGRHYDHFGGVSPINAQNRALLAAIQDEFARHDVRLPVYWGNRNWHPLLDEILVTMRADGVRKVLAFFTSAYSSYSGCRQYRENLAAAVADVGVGGDVTIERIGPYFNHPGFVEPFVDATVLALEELPVHRRAEAHLLFTTHSLPQALADSSGDGGVRAAGGAYVAQHQQVAEWVATAVARRTGVVRPWSLAYQSRSGPPEQPWLEPDVGVHLETLNRDGVGAVVFVPIGFVSDHVEVLWDLDVQAAARAEELHVAHVRAATPSTDPRFAAMVRGLVAERVEEVPLDRRSRIGGTSAAPDRCTRGCCANLRGATPAVAGQD
jgi:protoporphyrin/coproporphyrin ferrochelatase